MAGININESGRQCNRPIAQPFHRPRHWETIILDIYIDGDACPVKNETYRVALRHGLRVFVVTHGFVRVPDQPGVEIVLVAEGLDAADDWIAGRAGIGDICVTNDIPLAARVVKAGGRAIQPTGRVLDERTVGNLRATRDLMHDLREAGMIPGGGVPAFGKGDRSRYLSALDGLIVAIRRAQPLK